MIPQVPGYYWRIGPTLQSEGEVLHQIVEVNHWVSTAPNELFYWECGDMGAVFIKPEEDPNVRWAGPIPDADTITSLLEMKVASEHIP